MLYRLSYTHHIQKGLILAKLEKICQRETVLPLPPDKLARQEGLEPSTHGLEGRCSIQLSYWR